MRQTISLRVNVMADSQDKKNLASLTDLTKLAAFDQAKAMPTEIGAKDGLAMTDKPDKLREVNEKVDGLYADITDVRNEVSQVRDLADAATNRGLVKDINHDGYTIDNLKTDIGLGTSAGINHTVGAIENPTKDYDISKGYQALSNIVTKGGDIYICIDPEKGNAIWKKVTVS